jgi:prevent-host-death family protein
MSRLPKNRCTQGDSPLIRTLTTFRRRSGDLIKQLKKSKRPVVLTVNGNAAAVVQDAEAYQRLLDIAAHADAEEGIRQGLENAKKENSGRQNNFLTNSTRPMAYLVSITSRAERDLVHLYSQINAENSSAALNGT